MKEIFSLNNMKESEKSIINKGINSRELMYKAGLEVVNCTSFWGRIVVVCGPGNNGGDGYVIAQLLSDLKYDVTIILCENKFSVEGNYYFEKCLKKDIPTYQYNDEIDLTKYDYIIDCIFGTGFNKKVTSLYKEIINSINQANKYVLSVDINSGLNGDNGLGEIVVKSNLTIAIQAYKPGHFLNMAKDFIKDKMTCSIGVAPIYKPYYLIKQEDIIPLFKERKNFSNKSTYGYVSLIGGSNLYSGAIRLAGYANAAMRAGAGVVQVCAPNRLKDIISSSILESTFFPMKDDGNNIIFDSLNLDKLMQRSKAITYGMGIGFCQSTQKSLEYLLENYQGTLIIDADGITCLSKIPSDILDNSKATIILTPHTGEFSRLVNKTSEEILKRPIELAVEYAKLHHLVLLLKGPTTTITDGQDVYLVEEGCPGMATAGSGDVLSGIISAIAGYTKNPLEVAIMGAFINGRAGTIAQEKYGPISMIASDTIKEIPTIIKELYNY